MCHKYGIIRYTQETICLINGYTVGWGEDNVNKLTVDHILPKAHGGQDRVDNLAMCCKTCNEEKRDLLLTQFIRAFDYKIKMSPKIARFL